MAGSNPDIGEEHEKSPLSVDGYGYCSMKGVGVSIALFSSIAMRFVCDVYIVAYIR